MKKLLLATLPILIILNIKVANAQELFDTKYNVVYQIEQDLDTKVTKDIEIINKISDKYPSSFVLNYKFKDINQVQAFEGKNKLEVNVDKQDNQYSIKINFNNPKLGQNNSQKFKVEFKTTDLAYKVGNIKYINIPKIENLNNAQEYNVTIKAHKNLNQHLYIAPYTNKTEEGDYFIYKYTKEVLNNQGIQAAFGENQILEFKIKYLIENSKEISQTQTIVIPTDIKNRQSVYLQNINHLPEQSYLDKDGNLIFEYKLKPKETKEIQINGYAQLITKQININDGGDLKDIANNLKVYTLPQKFWEVTNPQVLEIAKKLMDQNLNISQNAFNIYNYVIKNLKYNEQNQDLNSKKGAVETLKNPNNVSNTGFSDTFITLLRANNIPAREINGYIIENETALMPLTTNKTDTVHTWAEYYDPSFGWVPVDPTLGHTSSFDYFTKLDNNHFTLVTKGISSETPVSAGNYKNNSEENHLDIKISNEQTINMNELDLKISKIFSLNPYYIFNNIRLYQMETGVKANLHNINNVEQTVPFNKYIVKVKDFAFIYQDYKEETLRLNLDDQSLAYDFKASTMQVVKELSILVLTILLYKIVGYLINHLLDR